MSFLDIANFNVTKHCVGINNANIHNVQNLASVYRSGIFMYTNANRIFGT